mgnify:CR=1 FL=1
MARKSFNPFRGDFNDYIGDDNEESDRQTKRTCKFCGKKNLNWEEEGVDGKWILYDAKTGEVHKCKPKSITDINKLMDSKL